MFSKEKINDIKNIELQFLKAIDINPSDDSDHGNINFLDIEWWYFDAVFDNNYSIHFGVRTYHIKKMGIVQLRINIYHYGKSIVEKKKVLLFSRFKTDNIYPEIYIDDEKIVSFDKINFNKNGNWSYHIKTEIEGVKVDLNFSGLTKGWKIETQKSCWAVPLPKASVSGNICFNDKIIDVKGLGYHDHNWNYSPITAMNNFGWYWGRITADSLNITWAKTMENIDKYDLISILNIDKINSGDNVGYYNIDPNNIVFKQSNFIKDHRCNIPTDFYLEINKFDLNKNLPIEVDIDMNMFDIQYTRIFTINYWRYHVKANGTIRLGDTIETLKDKPQIIEYLRFKS